jgi:hypothetical protein
MTSPDRPCSCGGALLYMGKWTNYIAPRQQPPKIPPPQFSHKWLCRSCNKIESED